MKIKRYLTICGKEFQLIVSAKGYNELYNLVNRYNGRTIFDCYSSCSYYKKSSSKEWAIWYLLLDSHDICSHSALSVISYNSNCYTDGALISCNGYYGILYITKDNNRLIFATREDMIQFSNAIMSVL